MLDSLPHQSDIRVIQEIHRSIKEDIQTWQQQNDTFRKPFGEFERTPINVHSEAQCLAIGKSGTVDNTQKPIAAQTTPKTGHGKDAKAMATENVSEEQMCTSPTSTQMKTS